VRTHSDAFGAEDLTEVVAELRVAGARFLVDHLRNGLLARLGCSSLVAMRVLQMRARPFRLVLIDRHEPSLLGAARVAAPAINDTVKAEGRAIADT
jgi:hypothetical protein